MATKKNALGTMAPHKTIKILLGLIVDRRFLCEFTWTGKTSKSTQSKNALRDSDRIVDLIYDMARQVHPKYTPEVYRKDMVDKVMKFAYE